MGFLKRLLGGGKKKPSNPKPKEDIYEIIGEYGSVLGAKAKTPSYVADESKLPYAKDQIKSAIIEALKINAMPQLRKQLRAAYLELSMWQTGVGPIDQIWTFDVFSMNRNDTPQNLARQLSDQNPDPKWERIILQENDKLKKELEDLGLG